MLWGIFFKNYSGAANEEISLIPLILFAFVVVWRKTSRVENTASCGHPDPVFLLARDQPSIAVDFGCHRPGRPAGELLMKRPLENWPSHARSLNLLLGIYFLILTFYLFQGLVQQPNPFACFLGFQSRSEFLSGILRPKGYVQVAETLNRRLPEDAKILILGQQNGYYLERVSVFDFDYNYPVLKRLTEKSSTPGGLYTQFRKNGITHILYNANSMLGTGIRVAGLGVDRYPWNPGELKNYEQFFLKYTRKSPLPVAEGYSLYEIVPREGFSIMPEYLPGTELYYLKNIQEAMGLPHLSDVVGKSIPSEAYLESYEEVADQHLELGYPCFQSAIALLSEPSRIFPGALGRGKRVFAETATRPVGSRCKGIRTLSRRKYPRPFLLSRKPKNSVPKRRTSLEI